MNLLFIGLIVLFMSHEQCNKHWTLKRKKKNVTTLDANANTHYPNGA